MLKFKRLNNKVIVKDSFFNEEVSVFIFLSLLYIKPQRPTI